MKKNRKLKRTEKSKQSMVVELLSLCLKIQEGQNGKIEERNSPGRPTIFFGFSGHTAGIEIRVHKNGWRENCLPDRTFNFYVDEGDSFSRDEFEVCRDYLLELIEEER